MRRGEDVVDLVLILVVVVSDCFFIVGQGLEGLLLD